MGNSQERGTKSSTSVSVHYLDVPIEDAHVVEKLGAKWDIQMKAWYVPAGSNFSLFKRWHNNFTKTTFVSSSAEGSNINRAFTSFLQDIGISLKEDPVMDGRWHHAQVITNTGEKQEAIYRGDANNATGLLHNFVSGETLSWSIMENQLTREQASVRQAETLIKKAKNISNKHEATNLVENIWQTARWATQDTCLILKEKNTKAYGVKVDHDGRLLIPLRDSSGQLHSIQIYESSSKIYFEGKMQAGLFHWIDPEEEARGKVPKSIVITENYHTAASLFEALRIPVTVAFKCSNLVAVAKNIRQVYPRAEIIIASNHTISHECKHPKLSLSALEVRKAAESVGGYIVAPELTKLQKEKGLTDWNDLACDSGLQEITRQFEVALNRHTNPNLNR